MTVVTRFAPSPTWFLHIWSLRTVLYNYLFSKQKWWKFMLRIEDTDRTRLVDWSVDNLINIFHIMWLNIDEGPNNPWDKWPYFQSKRLEIYHKYIKELIEKNKAYYCFCSSERLEKLREEQTSVWLPTKYDKACRYLSKEEVEEKLKSWLPYTVRLKVPENEEIIFEDVIKWKIVFNSKDIDEQILLKTDWFPTYHLANVVDDHLMEITHVIRWDEWTPSTPKHILLYKAFGWQAPVFAHIPLLLWDNKKKLSKRTWDVSVESYLEKWYLVEAILNYIALLWWNPKTTEEFFTIEELIEKFDLNAVHKAWAVFDIERLNFFNSHYIKNMDLDKLYDKLTIYLGVYNKEFLEIFLSKSKDYNLKVISELKTRIRFWGEFSELASIFYNETKIPEMELLLNEKMKITDLETVKKALNIWLKILKNENNDLSNFESIKNLFVEEINKAWMKNWQVLWPIRCALSWENFSPWALELIYIYWKEISIEKIEKTLEKIK